jgi:hypothetical protein
MFKNAVHTSKKTQRSTITIVNTVKVNIAVYTEKRTKPINTKYELLLQQVVPRWFSSL